MSTIILGIFEEGLIYAIMALGVYITYKILDFPDLSVDGTFPLGAAITATLILHQESLQPLMVLPIALVTLPIAFLVGAFAGVITGFIHVKLKVKDLLSGIIVMTALYSINLRIAGKANLPIFSRNTIFNNPLIDNHIPVSLQRYTIVGILIVITLIIKIILDLYLKTKSGYLLKAVGDNDVIVTSLAKDKGTVKILGLAIANGLAALAGAVYCQKQGFFEVSSGTGTIVIGLANVIIGTKVFSRITFMKPTTAVIIGSIIYKACVSLAISMGMAASDLKLVTSALFLTILVISNSKGKKVRSHA